MLGTVPRPAGAKSNQNYRAITVRVERELVEQLEAIARKEERSLNYIAARVFREWLAQQPKPKR